MSPSFPSPTLHTIAGFRLVGISQRQSLIHNTTHELWKRFMPRRHEVVPKEPGVLYSLEVYDGLDYFTAFDPAKEFSKWAAIEPADNNLLPAGMEALLVPAGRYAVFHYRGPASRGAALYQFIFTEWLPASGHALDDRPHFARMDVRYKGEAEDSEEEIWVPVK